MTRSDLITTIASRFPSLTAKDSEIAVKEILYAIVSAMSQGDRVEIRGFGSFGLNYWPARNGRNPSTGESVPVGERRVPHFKPGKDLRERVEASAKHTPHHPAASDLAER